MKELKACAYLKKGVGMGLYLLLFLRAFLNEPLFSKKTKRSFALAKDQVLEERKILECWRI